MKVMFLLTFVIVSSGCSQVSNGFKSNINPDTGDPYLNAHLPSYSCKGDLETVQKLLNLGLDHQIDDALECAVDSNKLELVKLLVDNGADIHMETSNGTNLLFEAIHKESYALLEYFLQEGLDPYQVDTDGYNILYHVVHNTDFDEKDSIVSMLHVLETLQEHDINMSTMKISDGWMNEYYPVMYALEMNKPLLLEAFLSLGMDLGLTQAEEDEFIKDFRYMLSGDNRLLACILYSKGDIPIYNTNPGMGYGKIEMYLPDCPYLLTEHYEESGFNDNGVTSHLIDSTISQELLNAEAAWEEKVQQENEALKRKQEADRIRIEAAAKEREEAKKQEKESEESQQNEDVPSATSMSLTAEQAKKILQNAFPDFTYYSGGSLSEEEFHEGKLTTEPAYMFVFTEDATGDPYVGWVFGDGKYKLRATMWGDE